MKTHALLLALVLAAPAASADEFVFTKKEIRQHPEMKSITAGLRSYKDGKVTYGSDEPSPVINFQPQTIGTFSGNVEGVFPVFDRDFSVPLTTFEAVKFDGRHDWLTVVMRNGDVIRGTAESLNAKTLRLRDRDKAIRMSDVREIVATEPPAAEAGE